MAKILNLSGVGQILLGAMFVATGVAKLIDRAHFEAILPSIVGGLFVNKRLAQFTSFGLSTTELVLGLLLIVGFQPRTVAAVSTVLMTIFTVVVLRILLRGVEAHCGCFGNMVEGKITWRTLIRNMAFLCLGILIVAIPNVANPATLTRSIVWSLVMGISSASAILLVTQYLETKRVFLPFPVPANQSAIRWR